ncbi:MAG TPA: hypothetical protein VMG60_08855 [Burkholderiaceae bacterium]|nr:hypothetical protein [Burkholderiaceae bacterium]
MIHDVHLRVRRSVLALLLCVAACTTEQAPPAAQNKNPASSDQAPPANWDPAYWDRSMRDARDLRDRGDRGAAEHACARGILYVQAQTIKVLYGYADVLDQQSLGSGIPMRSKVQKLEQARNSSNTYLGFDPSAELRNYADLLAGMKRKNEALLAEALAAAYRYAQEANMRRATLQREGKDPIGEC